MAKARRLIANIDGYRWEILLSGLRVELRRSRFPMAGAEDQTFALVAVGEWDGERIAIGAWFENRGDALRMPRAMPRLVEMIRMALQGG